MISESRQNHWVSLFIFLLIGYGAIFLQARFTLFRDIFGFQFDLAPGLVVYAAIHFHFFPALGCAAALGIMYDLLSANPLGTTLLAFAAVTFVAAYFRELLLSEEFTAQFVLGAGATFGSIFLSLFVLYMSGQQPLVGIWSVWIWLIVSAGGGLVTPLWFKLFAWLDEALRYKEVPESSFRSDRQIARGRY